MTLTYRDATLNDVAAVVALVQSAYRGEASRAGWTTEADLLDGQRTDPDDVREIIESPDSRIRLGHDDAAGLVVCCQLERKPGGSCHFGMFAVSPTRQAGGIGREMLAEAERIAADELGAHTMEMTVITQRRELIAWYERRGYTVTGESRPFPHSDERFGLPRRTDLVFEVLAKPLG